MGILNIILFLCIFKTFPNKILFYKFRPTQSNILHSYWGYTGKCLKNSFLEKEKKKTKPDLEHLSTSKYYHDKLSVTKVIP